MDKNNFNKNPNHFLNTFLNELPPAKFTADQINTIISELNYESELNYLPYLQDDHTFIIKIFSAEGEFLRTL